MPKSRPSFWLTVTGTGKGRGETLNDGRIDGFY